MRRLALILVLLAAPAQAEAPRISLVFSSDTLTAQGSDIQSLRRVDQGTAGSALVIRLSPAFDAQMLAFTQAHVGETGTLMICGETVLEPYLNSAIAEATFVISDTDPSHIDRLQALLNGPTCDDVPGS